MRSSKIRRVSILFKKAVACCLAMTLCFQGYGAPALANAFSVPAGIEQKAISLLDVNLPQEMGSIKEKFDGQTGKVVFIIQDAHAIPEAQRSIQKLIEFSEKEYGVGVVALEGAASDLDAQIFKSFPDKEQLKKVFEGYFERGELTGGTAAALFSESPSHYQGIEDWDLYQEGLHYFLESMRLEAAASSELNSLFEQLQAEKKKTYSAQLLFIDQTLRAFHQNAADLMGVLEKLASVEPPHKDSELALLLEEMGHSKENEIAIDAEVKQIAGQIRTALIARTASPATKKALLEFNQQFQAFQTGQIAPEAMALFLKGLAIQHQIRVRVSKRLNARVGKQKRMKDIEGTQLFDEFESYAEGIKQSLLRSDEERTLNLRNHLLELVERLTKLELTQPNWTELKAALIKMDAWTISQDGVDRQGEIAALLKKMQAPINFYHNAEKRDKIFARQTEMLFKKHDTKAITLVAGGFHAEGITELLRAKGISYALIMPAIKTMPDETNYRDHMQGKVTWGDYFEVKDGKVNLYNAFVRGARDKLLASSVQRSAASLMVPGTFRDRFSEPVPAVPGTILKNWRDQIIRDLADQNKIAEAGEYTRFIDELSTSRKSKGPGSPDQNDVIAQWRTNVDQFVKGLRQLHDKNLMSEKTIAALLPGTTVSDPVTYNMFARSEIRVGLLPSLGLAVERGFEPGIWRPEGPQGATRPEQRMGDASDQDLVVFDDDEFEKDFKIKVPRNTAEYRENIQTQLHSKDFILNSLRAIYPDEPFEDDLKIELQFRGDRHARGAFKDFNVVTVKIDGKEFQLGLLFGKIDQSEVDEKKTLSLNANLRVPRLGAERDVASSSEGLPSLRLLAVEHIEGKELWALIGEGRYEEAFNHYLDLALTLFSEGIGVTDLNSANIVLGQEGPSLVDHGAFAAEESDSLSAESDIFGSHILFDALTKGLINSGYGLNKIASGLRKDELLEKLAQSAAEKILTISSDGGKLLQSQIVYIQARTTALKSEADFDSSLRAQLLDEFAQALSANNLGVVRSEVRKSGEPWFLNTDARDAERIGRILGVRFSSGDDLNTILPRVFSESSMKIVNDILERVERRTQLTLPEKLRLVIALVNLYRHSGSSASVLEQALKILITADLNESVEKRQTQASQAYLDKFAVKQAAVPDTEVPLAVSIFEGLASLVLGTEGAGPEIIKHVNSESQYRHAYKSKGDVLILLSEYSRAVTEVKQIAVDLNALALSDPARALRETAAKLKVQFDELQGAATSHEKSLALLKIKILVGLLHDVPSLVIENPEMDTPVRLYGLMFLFSNPQKIKVDVKQMRDLFETLKEPALNHIQQSMKNPASEQLLYDTSLSLPIRNFYHKTFTAALWVLLPVIEGEGWWAAGLEPLSAMGQVLFDRASLVPKSDGAHGPTLSYGLNEGASFPVYVGIMAHEWEHPNIASRYRIRSEDGVYLLLSGEEIAADLVTARMYEVIADGDTQQAAAWFGEYQKQTNYKIDRKRLDESGGITSDSHDGRGWMQQVYELGAANGISTAEISRAAHDSMLRMKRGSYDWFNRPTLETFIRTLAGEMQQEGLAITFRDQPSPTLLSSQEYLPPVESVKTIKGTIPLVDGGSPGVARSENRVSDAVVMLMGPVEIRDDEKMLNSAEMAELRAELSEIGLTVQDADLNAFIFDQQLNLTNWLRAQLGDKAAIDKVAPHLLLKIRNEAKVRVGMRIFRTRLAFWGEDSKHQDQQAALYRILKVHLGVDFDFQNKAIVRARGEAEVSQLTKLTQRDPTALPDSVTQTLDQWMDSTSGVFRVPDSHFMVDQTGESLFGIEEIDASQVLFQFDYFMDGNKAAVEVLPPERRFRPFQKYESDSGVRKLRAVLYVRDQRLYLLAGDLQGDRDASDPVPFYRNFSEIGQYLADQFGQPVILDQETVILEDPSADLGLVQVKPTQSLIKRLWIRDIQPLGGHVENLSVQGIDPSIFNYYQGRFDAQTPSEPSKAELADFSTALGEHSFTHEQLLAWHRAVEKVSRLIKDISREQIIQKLAQLRLEGPDSGNLLNSQDPRTLIAMTVLATAGRNGLVSADVAHMARSMDGDGQSSLGLGIVISYWIARLNQLPSSADKVDQKRKILNELITLAFNTPFFAPGNRHYSLLEHYLLGQLIRLYKSTDSWNPEQLPDQFENPEDAAIAAKIARLSIRGGPETSNYQRYLRMALHSSAESLKSFIETSADHNELVDRVLSIQVKANNDGRPNDPNVTMLIRAAKQVGQSPAMQEKLRSIFDQPNVSINARVIILSLMRLDEPFLWDVVRNQSLPVYTRLIALAHYGTLEAFPTDLIEQLLAEFDQATDPKARFREVVKKARVAPAIMVQSQSVIETIRLAKSMADALINDRTFSAALGQVSETGGIYYSGEYVTGWEVDNANSDYRVGNDLLDQMSLDGVGGILRHEAAHNFSAREIPTFKGAVFGEEYDSFFSGVSEIVSNLAELARREELQGPLSAKDVEEVADMNIANIHEHTFLESQTEGHVVARATLLRFIQTNPPETVNFRQLFLSVFTHLRTSAYDVSDRAELETAKARVEKLHDLLLIGTEGIVTTEKSSRVQRSEVRANTELAKLVYDVNQDIVKLSHERALTVRERIVITSDAWLPNAEQQQRIEDVTSFQLDVRDDGMVLVNVFMNVFDESEDGRRGQRRAWAVPASNVTNLLFVEGDTKAEDALYVKMNYEDGVDHEFRFTSLLRFPGRPSDEELRDSVPEVTGSHRAPYPKADIKRVRSEMRTTAVALGEEELTNLQSSALQTMEKMRKNFRGADEEGEAYEIQKNTREYRIGMAATKRVLRIIEHRAGIGQIAQLILERLRLVWTESLGSSHAIDLEGFIYIHLSMGKRGDKSQKDYFYSIASEIGHALHFAAGLLIGNRKGKINRGVAEVYDRLVQSIIEDELGEANWRDSLTMDALIGEAFVEFIAANPQFSNMSQDNKNWEDFLKAFLNRLSAKYGVSEKEDVRRYLHRAAHDAYYGFDHHIGAYILQTLLQKYDGHLDATARVLVLALKHQEGISFHDPTSFIGDLEALPTRYLNEKSEGYKSQGFLALAQLILLEMADEYVSLVRRLFALWARIVIKVSIWFKQLEALRKNIIEAGALVTKGADQIKAMLRALMVVKAHQDQRDEEAVQVLEEEPVSDARRLATDTIKALKDLSPDIIIQRPPNEFVVIENTKEPEYRNFIKLFNTSIIDSKDFLTKKIEPSRPSIQNRLFRVLRDTGRIVLYASRQSTAGLFRITQQLAEGWNLARDLLRFKLIEFLLKRERLPMPRTADEAEKAAILPDTTAEVVPTQEAEPSIMFPEMAVELAFGLLKQMQETGLHLIEERLPQVRVDLTETQSAFSSLEGRPSNRVQFAEDVAVFMQAVTQGNFKKMMESASALENPKGVRFNSGSALYQQLLLKNKILGIFAWLRESDLLSDYGSFLGLAKMDRWRASDLLTTLRQRRLGPEDFARLEEGFLEIQGILGARDPHAKALIQAFEGLKELARMQQTSDETLQSADVESTIQRGEGRSEVRALEASEIFYVVPGLRQPAIAGRDAAGRAIASRQLKVSFRDQADGKIKKALLTRGAKTGWLLVVEGQDVSGQREKQNFNLEDKAHLNLVLPFLNQVALKTPAKQAFFAQQESKSFWESFLNLLDPAVADEIRQTTPAELTAGQVEEKLVDAWAAATQNYLKPLDLLALTLSTTAEFGQDVLPQDPLGPAAQQKRAEESAVLAAHIALKGLVEGLLVDQETGVVLKSRKDFERIAMDIAGKALTAQMLRRGRTPQELIPVAIPANWKIDEIRFDNGVTQNSSTSTPRTFEISADLAVEGGIELVTLTFSSDGKIALVFPQAKFAVNQNKAAELKLISGGSDKAAARLTEALENAFNKKPFSFHGAQEKALNRELREHAVEWQWLLDWPDVPARWKNILRTSLQRSEVRTEGVPRDAVPEHLQPAWDAFSEFGIPIQYDKAAGVLRVDPFSFHRENNEAFWASFLNYGLDDKTDAERMSKLEGLIYQKATAEDGRSAREKIMDALVEEHLADGSLPLSWDEISVEKEKLELALDIAPHLLEKQEKQGKSSQIRFEVLPTKSGRIPVVAKMNRQGVMDEDIKAEGYLGFILHRLGLVKSRVFSVQLPNGENALAFTIIPATPDQDNPGDAYFNSHLPRNLILRALFNSDLNAVEGLKTPTGFAAYDLGLLVHFLQKSFLGFAEEYNQKLKKRLTEIAAAENKGQIKEIIYKSGHDGLFFRIANVADPVFISDRRILEEDILPLANMSMEQTDDHTLVFRLGDNQRQINQGSSWETIGKTLNDLLGRGFQIEARVADKRSEMRQMDEVTAGQGDSLPLVTIADVPWLDLNEATAKELVGAVYRATTSGVGSEGVLVFESRGHQVRYAASPRERIGQEQEVRYRHLIGTEKQNRLLVDVIVWGLTGGPVFILTPIAASEGRSEHQDPAAQIKYYSDLILFAKTLIQGGLKKESRVLRSPFPEELLDSAKEITLEDIAGFNEESLRLFFTKRENPEKRSEIRAQKKSRIQFGLRTVMIGMTVLGMGLAWQVHQHYRGKASVLMEENGQLGSGLGAWHIQNAVVTEDSRVTQNLLSEAKRQIKSSNAGLRMEALVALEAVGTGDHLKMILAYLGNTSAQTEKTELEQAYQTIRAIMSRTETKPASYDRLLDHLFTAGEAKALGASLRERNPENKEHARLLAQTLRGNDSAVFVEGLSSNPNMDLVLEFVNEILKTENNYSESAKFQAIKTLRGFFETFRDQLDDEERGRILKALNLRVLDASNPRHQAAAINELQHLAIVRTANLSQDNSNVMIETAEALLQGKGDFSMQERAVDLLANLLRNSDNKQLGVLNQTRIIKRLTETALLPLGAGQFNNPPLMAVLHLDKFLNYADSLPNGAKTQLEAGLQRAAGKDASQKSVREEAARALSFKRSEMRSSDAKQKQLAFNVPEPLEKSGVVESEEAFTNWKENVLRRWFDEGQLKIFRLTGPVENSIELSNFEGPERQAFAWRRMIQAMTTYWDWQKSNGGESAFSYQFSKEGELVIRGKSILGFAVPQSEVPKESGTSQPPVAELTNQSSIRAEVRNVKGLLQQARDENLSVDERLQVLEELEAYFTDREYAAIFSSWHEFFQWGDAGELAVVLEALRESSQDQAVQNAAKNVRANIIEKMGPRVSVEELSKMRDEQVSREIYYLTAWNNLWSLPLSFEQIRPYAPLLRRAVSLQFVNSSGAAYGWLEAWEAMNDFKDQFALEDFLVGFSMMDAVHRESALRLLKNYLAQADQSVDDRILSLFDEKLRDIKAFPLPQKLDESAAAEREQQRNEMTSQEQTGQAGFSMVFDNLIGAGPYNLFDFLGEKLSEKRLELTLALVRDFERDSEERQTHEHTALEDKPFPHVRWDNIRGENAYAALGPLAARDFLAQITQAWGTPEQSRVGEDLSRVIGGLGETAQITKNQAYQGVFFNPQVFIGVYKQEVSAAKNARAKEIAEYALEIASARSENRLQNLRGSVTEVLTTVRFLLDALKPGEGQRLNQPEIGQIYELSRENLAGLIQTILETLEQEIEALNAREGETQTKIQSDGALGLRATIEFAKAFLTATSEEGLPENIALAVDFLPDADREAFLMEIIKGISSLGTRAEVLSDADTHQSLSKKISRAWSWLRLKKLTPKDLRDGTVVSEEGLGVVTALNDLKRAGSLNKIFQGVLFNSEDMPQDPDSQLAGQILFATFLIKLAIISAQRKNEKHPNRAEFLKAALIRAIQDAGYSTAASQKALDPKSGGLISIMGRAFINALVQDMRTHQEVGQAA